VDHRRDRRTNRALGDGEPKWRSERVSLGRDTSPAPPADDPEPPLRFTGRVVNAEPDAFVLRAERHRNVFLARAWQPERARNKGSVLAFMSVFTWCDEAAGLMYGAWRDFDPGGRPTSYSTVWSRDELTLEEIQAVALHAAGTFGLNALEEHELNRHPQ
jgi:hypothetical protein